ncbi:MAG: hypothetical protein V2J55_22600 [Candidatus Competibacteraceae bacterium]|jgi:predicted metal-dependent HD superfamily phosphohydrolase|nr:hypothetical protein [Candidatus Competibacteraceae bacterium]
MSATLSSNVTKCQDITRFLRLWEKVPVDSSRIKPEQIHAELVTRYSEPHRHYHTCEHIGHCLNQLELASAEIDHPAAVGIALWFHDVIYDPRATDNEQQSAELFMRWVGDHADPQFSEIVYEAILITKHREIPRTLTEQFVVDIDLSSFGLPEPVFDQNSRDIRAEYAHVPDAEFFPAHLKFLESLFAKPTLYFTDFFHTHYEAIARANFQRLLATAPR